MTTKSEHFTHGVHYGDYFGVIFYGPPTGGQWTDRLAISDCYIIPLFRGVLDRVWQETGGEGMPQLVSNWNTLTGWAGSGAGLVSISTQDACTFAVALADLTPEDVAPHCAGCTVAECLECAGLIREFIVSHLAHGDKLWIVDD